APGSRLVALAQGTRRTTGAANGNNIDVNGTEDTCPANRVSGRAPRQGATRRSA
ncbi:MAG: hypothetical protein QG608_3581, partial [Actinomycetota bacterium]|nr:hypothetical protein [Actinomycetota bacterium]